MKQNDIILIKQSILSIVYEATITHQPICARDLLKQLHCQNISISKTTLYRYLNELSASGYLLLPSEIIDPDDPPRNGIVYYLDTPLPDEPLTELRHIFKSDENRQRILDYLAEQETHQDTLYNISYALNINLSTLKRYVRVLRKQGYVKSLSGKGGGIRLLHTC